MKRASPRPRTSTCACQKAFNHAMGPLDTIDFSGLDTTSGSRTTWRRTTASGSSRPQKLRALVTAGHLGRKTGRGLRDDGETREHASRRDRRRRRHGHGRQPAGQRARRPTLEALGATRPASSRLTRRSCRGPDRRGRQGVPGRRGPAPSSATRSATTRDGGPRGTDPARRSRPGARSRCRSIAAVAGNAVGGGLEFALVCDLIVADPKARLGLPESRSGLMPGRRRDTAAPAADRLRAARWSRCSTGKPSAPRSARARQRHR